MATREFLERENFFYKARSDAFMLMDHPDFKPPEHRYVGRLREMIEFAVLGVIDTGNGLLHAERDPYHRGIVIVPVLKSDVRKNASSVTVSPGLCRQSNVDEVCDIASVCELSAECDYAESIVNPFLKFPYWMFDRAPLIVGSALIHETDHAYYYYNAKRLLADCEGDTDIENAKMEVSAYSLEEQLFFAHAPQIYDEEYDRISRRFADLDFEREYKTRCIDKVRKSARNLALVCFMCDELGVSVGQTPPPQLVEAFKQQAII